MFKLEASKTSDKMWTLEATCDRYTKVGNHREAFLFAKARFCYTETNSRGNLCENSIQN